MSCTEFVDTFMLYLINILHPLLQCIISFRHQMESWIWISHSRYAVLHSTKTLPEYNVIYFEAVRHTEFQYRMQRYQWSWSFEIRIALMSD